MHKRDTSATAYGQPMMGYGAPKHENCVTEYVTVCDPYMNNGGYGNFFPYFLMKKFT